MHLPWVGPLFRDTTKNKERDELIIFIQPTVVQSDPDILAASEGEKNRADTGRDAFQFGQAPVLPQTQLDSFYPKKAAPSKGLNK
jgi:type II secretory pathway component GspD/PulD (secretin)